jgi:catechol 2,3-dioxygenase
MRRLTAPLDVDDLLSELKHKPGEWEGMPHETQVGHVHLHVSDLNETRQFYHDLLGFDIKLESSNSACFSSALVATIITLAAISGMGAGAPPPPPSAAGLRSFTVILPDQHEFAV